MSTPTSPTPNGQPRQPTGTTPTQPHPTTQQRPPQSQQQRRHIWLITGPAGCGKSTIASYLASSLNLPFLEGDDYHPPTNVSKMAQGHPLTDADRWDWLVLLRETCVESLSSTGGGASGGGGGGAKGVVLTCSALKRKYRDVFRTATYFDESVSVHFVYLRASEELTLSRVRARHGHFMKDDMVHSQFATLEEPSEEELGRDCLNVDVKGEVPEVQRLALEAVKGALGRVVERTHVES